jgi:hypothetical protein
VEADCAVGWADTGDLTNLTDIGGMQHGEFESNGDIAGIGARLHLIICVSSLMPIGSAIICLSKDHNVGICCAHAGRNNAQSSTDKDCNKPWVSVLFGLFTRRSN